MALDLSQRVRTKSGLAVRIVATRLTSSRGIAGILTAADGTETVEQWTTDGFKIDALTPSPLDLENLPGPIPGFVNVYDGPLPRTFEVTHYLTKADADADPRAGRVARVFFSFRRGQLDG